MNCKETKDMWVDYQDQTLDEVTRISVQSHLNSCAECSRSLNEFQALFETIGLYKEELPASQLEQNFDKMIADEKLILTKSKIVVFNKQKKQFKTVLQIAAAIVLMVSSYWYGAFEKQDENTIEIALLKQEKAEMQTIATLSLIENESASKRLQAVNYAKTLVHPDNDILNVLIRKMNNDKHVNVRLAAANALSKFASNDMVRQALVSTLEIEKNANMQIELIQILVDVEEKRVIPTMKKLLDNIETPAYLKEQINSELNQII